MPNYIDLCIIRLHQDFTPAAIAKAEAAYEVVEPLRRAIAAFQQAPDYRDRCYSALAIANPEQVMDGLNQLAADFGLD